MRIKQAPRPDQESTTIGPKIAAHRPQQRTTHLDEATSVGGLFPAERDLGKGTHMDRALSLLISAGIAAFGVWIVGYTMASGSPLGWTFMGILPIILGSISLYQAIGETRVA